MRYASLLLARGTFLIRKTEFPLPVPVEEYSLATAIPVPSLISGISRELDGR